MDVYLQRYNFDINIKGMFVDIKNLPIIPDSREVKTGELQF